MHDSSAEEDRRLKEIEADFSAHGFPEIDLLWKIAKRKKFHEKALTEAQILRARRRHTAILFGYPCCGALIILAFSFAAVWYGEYLLSLLISLPEYFSQKTYELPHMERARFTLVRVFSFGVKLGGVYFLFLMLSGATQRYVLWPFNTLMARELAFMVRKRTWRGWLAAQDSAIAFRGQMLFGSINGHWDSPDYVARYRTTKDGYEPADVLSRCESVLQFLREFIGKKDPLTRKFVPGRYHSQLRDGKESVTRFVNEHAEAIAALKEDDLDKNECLALLSALNTFLTEESGAKIILDRKIAAVKNDISLEDGEVQAEIWQREPLLDLTHQEEFFSSASLRGVKLVGRGARGRLAPFAYLWNRSISALDFRTQKGRLVRARIALAELLKFKETFVLFVDGVEGSNSIATEVIEKGILDYAATCGFRFVVFNALVHNKIPRRFLSYLLRKGLTAQEIDLRYVENECREYLDAFGFPLQPFEYQRPIGRVVTYILDARTGEEVILGEARTLRNRIWQTIRMNCYWILMSVGGLGGLVAGLLLAPIMALGLLLVCLPLLVIHLRYHRKALRKLS